MPQRTNSRSSPKANPNAVADTGKASPLSNSAPKPRPAEGGVDIRPSECIERCGTDEAKALDRPDTPLKTPQGWEPELSDFDFDFDFDFTASPGAEEWQIGETADGRAVYSTVGAAGVGVTVEFQKWDW